MLAALPGQAACFSFQCNRQTWLGILIKNGQKPICNGFVKRGRGATSARRPLKPQEKTRGKKHEEKLTVEKMHTVAVATALSELNDILYTRRTMNGTKGWILLSLQDKLWARLQLNIAQCSLATRLWHYELNRYIHASHYCIIDIKQTPVHSCMAKPWLIMCGK